MKRYGEAEFVNHRRIIRTWAMAGGSLAVLATVAVGISQAQTTPAARPATPQTVNSKAIRAAAVAGNSASASSAAPQAIYKPNFRPGPVLLRKPQGPAMVLWSAARAQATRMRQVHPVNTLLSRLPKADLDHTQLPVLLPRDGGTVAVDKSRLFSFGDAYAINLPQAKGTQLTMYGNRAFVPADNGAVSKKPALRLAGMPEDVRIDQTEDGWTATFTRYGVVYSLDVTCDDMGSPDCTSDSYLRKQIAQFDDVALGQDANSEADGKLAPPGPKPKPAATTGNWFDQAVKNLTGGKQ